MARIEKGETIQSQVQQPLVILVVALLKPMTSYFLVSCNFSPQKDLWSSCCLQKYFLGMSSRASKKIPKMGAVGELRPNAINVIRPPPPIPPPQCNDLPCIYSLVANQVMQSHGGKISACNFIT